LATLVPESATSAEEPFEIGAAAASQLRHAQLRIVGGQLLATTNEARTSAYNRSDAQRQEKLTLGNEGSLVTLHYELSTPAARLSYDIARGRDVRLQYQAQGDAPSEELEYTQQTDGPSRLRIAEGELVVERSGPSFYHVLLSLTPEQRERPIWLIEFIRRQWKLDEKLSVLNFNLLRSEYAPSPVTRQQLAGWIRQLGSNHFSERQAAERSLRAAGQGVLPLLREAERGRLDAEQRFRLRSILQASGDDQQDDTVERASAALSVDPYLWYALLQRERLVRQFAVRRLSQLLGEPIDFDPLADVSTRQAQFEKLDGQLRRMLSLTE
jgi:hypothetical protein